MLRTLTKITITQKTDFNGTPRGKVFIFDFINEGEIVSTWKNLTDTAKLKFPKNIYFKDQFGNKVNWQGQNVTAGDNTPPLLMRGDAIKIELGYKMNEQGGETKPMNEEFDGFISKIVNRMPIEISCEDRMWLLKQVKAPNRVFTGSVNDMIRTLLDLDPRTKDIQFPKKGTTTQVEINVGPFRTQNETIAQVLYRLQKDYRLYSYFRKTAGVYELRMGIVYYPQDRNVVRYDFQKNIHANGDELEYRRKEDLQIGIKAYSILREELTVTNEDGSQKTKQKRLEVFVSQNGELKEESFHGDIVTRYYWNITSKTELIELARRDLVKYYYTGLYGAFSTFILPFIKHGDEIVFKDKVLPERNGSYLCEGVVTTFGMGGHHRRVQPHLRIDGNLSNAQLAAGI